MTTVKQATPRDNHLLAKLSENALARLMPNLELVSLSSGQLVHEPGQQQEFVYFPSTCIVALLHGTTQDESARVAITGREGVVGIVQLLGGNVASMKATVQNAGQAWRLASTHFKTEYFRATGLMTQCMRYAQLLIAQMAQLAVCGRHHRLEQQLCGWLLQTLDRLPGCEIDNTQEMIASLLGVRRQGISEASAKLESEGAISHRRGRISVLDRALLEERSCECYHGIRQEHRRLLPSPSGQPDKPGADMHRQYREVQRRSDRMALALTVSEQGWWDVNLLARADTPGGRLCFELLGYEQDEADTTLDRWIGRIHPEDVMTRAQAWRAHLEHEKAFYECDYRIRHKEGHWIWLGSRGKLVCDAQGRPERMMGVCMEITARKAYEESLRALACTDFLTGTVTRRHLFELAEREFSRSMRYRSPLSVLILDLDHFKRINDTHGHRGGDLVLLAFVSTVKVFLREADVLGRLGGEEFGILLPQTNIEGATALAQRVLEAVRQSAVPVNGRVVRFTVSVGLSSYAGEGAQTNFDTLLDEADKALYRAKKRGRDRLELAPTRH
jgi:diguanylate cyclase (GGDEF)-like protein/PAS domain S-box-containing protein